ncbi:hypothetical protein QL285_095979 [Trifolium repens]|nr:hypothetical protein QL285_095979 [Trifolium repens]
MEGFGYAWRLRFRKVELNVDSVAVVKVIKEGETNSVMGYSLVKEIHRLFSLEWEVKILHSYQEANRCADALPNMGCSFCGNVVFYEECYNQLVQLLVYVVLGSSTSRLILV